MIEVAPLTYHDLKAVAALERRAGDVGWSAPQFARELELPFSRFCVARLGGHLVGYGGFWKIADEAQMTNLVVAPEVRRRGIGRSLLDHLLVRARAERCVRFLLEVRASNAPAQTLYRRAGFHPTGRRPRAYTQPIEDAVLMERSW